MAVDTRPSVGAMTARDCLSESNARVFYCSPIDDSCWKDDEMTTDQVYKRYRELQDYVGWTSEDEQIVGALKSLVEPSFPELIDDFYAEIQRHPDALKVITGGPAQIERLKQTLVGWLGDLFSGRYDQDYVDRRWKIGHRHVEIGLNQVYTNAALSRLRRGLLQVLERSWPGAMADLLRARTVLNTLLDLDLALIEDAYQTELLARQHSIKRMVQSERLAAIGEAMTGLTHESRNALQRSQACLEMLSRRVADRPEAVELVQRIQRAQDDLHQLYEEVRQYAAPLKLDPRPTAILDVVGETWEQLKLTRHARDARLMLPGFPSGTNLCIDRFAMRQVFRNILENALAACTDPVRIEISVESSAREGVSGTRIAIRDNGPGLSEEQRAGIFRPYYTTKTQGTGLGMTICQRIVEAHGGEMSLGAGPGAEILIWLPAEGPAEQRIHSTFEPLNAPALSSETQ